jgi:curved DNA-binding protein CbpA
MTYADLQEALRTLGLGERASLKEIKARHRELVKRHHPDTGNAADPERIRQINAAYRLLLDYVGDYRFSFAEEEFYTQCPEARIWMQFADDPLWGKR